ncbi:hypothetical protein MMC34_007695 [Xylographa carneopallida]|nr:hypothetical protein [Xylographa carneopallida]
MTRSKSKSTLIAKAPTTQAKEKSASTTAALPTAADTPSGAESPTAVLERQNSASEELSAALRPPPKGASFESFYLQAVTREFADDIDKVRNASDFKDSSLPILIEALRQGVGIYGEDERQRVMGRGK